MEELLNNLNRPLGSKPLEKSIVEHYLKGYYAGYITSTEACEMIDLLNVCNDYNQDDMVNRIVSKLTKNSIDND